MTRSRFTAGDDQYIIAHYRKDQTVKQIAASLNRSVTSIYQRAFVLELAKPMVFISDEQIVAVILAKHPLGWSDSEIKAAIESEYSITANRHRIGKLRNSLGLASNRDSSHHRNRVREKTKQQLAQAGLSSLADVRRAAFDAWKRDLGRPEHLTMRAVQSLEMFYRRGPMTRLQLCAALGIDAKKRIKRTEPTSNGPGGTVLAELAAAGLVMCLQKSVKSGFDRRGGIRKVNLYMLNPGVEPNGETRKYAAAV